MRRTLSRQRRHLSLGDLIKFAPRMRPAGGKLDLAAGGQPLEPGIAIDVKHALKLPEMRFRPFGPPIRCVDEDRCQRIRAAPPALLAGIGPEPAGLGPAASRIDTGTGVSSANRMSEPNTCSLSRRCRASSHHGAADPTRQRPNAAGRRHDGRRFSTADKEGCDRSIWRPAPGR